MLAHTWRLTALLSMTLTAGLATPVHPPLLPIDCEFIDPATLKVVRVSAHSGASGGVLVTIAPRGAPLPEATSVPGGSKRVAYSDCYAGYSYSVTPTVNWSSVQDCSEIELVSDACE
jgi:hypothetical protein